MKRILAVIPARAGSKGIPNKNLRLIKGRPLIYYAINNAIQSKYITDIIVTTDSPLISQFAKQLNIPIRHRPSELCGDEITLDSVVYDAIPKDINWDYIVTMQPTSPTLKVDSLDQAIFMAIEKDLDTVLSAINTPHLSWSDKNGQKVPNYTIRANRQYLPPEYSETGAFVISKASIVTQNTRIGKKIDIFELSEPESIDIDNFFDLIVAKNILKNEHIGFYVNGNSLIGTGHIYRVLELADEFDSKPDIYYDLNQTKPKIFGDTTHHIIPIENQYDLFSKLQNTTYSIFINDILDTTTDFMSSLRKILPATKIINFEDEGEGSNLADLTINALYTKSKSPKVKSGADYFIANKNFLFYQPINIRPNVQKVLITFGGADPQKYTEQILEIIQSPEYAKYHFTILFGKAKENSNEIIRTIKSTNIQTFKDVKNIPEIMSQHDLAITSRGRTCYELAILGIPTLVMAQNEREERHTFASSDNGFTYIGMAPSSATIKSSLDNLLNSSIETRQHLQYLMLQTNLKQGREHCMQAINNIQNRKDHK